MHSWLSVSEYYEINVSLRLIFYLYMFIFITDGFVIYITRCNIRPWRLGHPIQAELRFVKIQVNILKTFVFNLRHVTFFST